MGAKTKIDWCDSSWNPVTGCQHGCKYCYAQRIAERFDGGFLEMEGQVSDDLKSIRLRKATTHVLEEPKEKSDGKKSPYPFGFEPTFHRYRLDEPKHWKKPRNIFVCSMADLFGEWVPNWWIRNVFESCDKAPQHRYLFLTKNPERYTKLLELLPNHRRPPHVAELWFGTSYTGETKYYCPKTYAFFFRFVSVEPLLKALTEMDCHGLAICNNWVIIGAETGNRKNKVVPERAWIDRIVAECDEYETPVFMKESLRPIMGDDFRQEFPWEVVRR